VTYERERERVGGIKKREEMLSNNWFSVYISSLSLVRCYLHRIEFFAAVSRSCIKSSFISRVYVRVVGRGKEMRGNRAIRSFKQ
jgi:hypothetical protein